MKNKDVFYRPLINSNDEDRGQQEYENTHHILPRSRGGTNDENNKIKLYLSLHNSLHRLFGNGTPQEQIQQLLKINSQALTDEFCADVMHILREDDPGYYFKNGILRK